MGEGKGYKFPVISSEDIMYSIVTTVNTVLYIWKLLKVDFKSSHHIPKIVTMWGHGCVIKPYCHNHSAIYTFIKSLHYIYHKLAQCYMSIISQ